MKMLDKPNTEGFWWVFAKDGSGREQRTVACVSVMQRGIIIFHLIGYTQQFTDLDLSEGRPLYQSKWKKIAE